VAEPVVLCRIFGGPNHRHDRVRGGGNLLGCRAWKSIGEQYLQLLSIKHGWTPANTYATPMPVFSPDYRRAGQS
jgi:hypothetical protein